MFSKKFAAVSFFIGLSSLLAGCEQETTKDQVADAQYCLDKATDASAANACVAKIASIDTPTANALRCSAGFIAAGVTKTENLSKALTAIKDSNAGGSSATTMMSFLNLGSDDQAASIFNNCVASNNKGMALVAAMAKTATTLINIVGTYNPATVEADLKAKIDQLAAADPNTILPELEKIGAGISTVYQVTCGGTTVGSNDICKSIDSALADYNNGAAPADSIDLSSTTLDADKIGKALLDFWKKQNAP